MNIFSEIYGAYYRTAARILEREKITKEEIRRIISEEAFRDSMLYIEPKLIPKNNCSDWHLLESNSDSSFSRITSLPPPKIITNLQKSWLKAKLSDPKFRLFFDDSTLIRLTERLKDVKPLYRMEHFYYPDVFSDGDDYSSEDYRRIFQTAVSAMKTKEILEITYRSSRDKEIRGYIIPVKMIYSRKNDKFRMYVYFWRNLPCINQHRRHPIMNIGRITELKPTGVFYTNKISESRIIESERCDEPVKVFVSTARNGVERFMMEFAAYEKYTVRDLSTGCCTVDLWYDKSDETEVLIRLLSFGPTIEILGPSSFRKQAAERIRHQYELLFTNEAKEPASSLTEQ